MITHSALGKGNSSSDFTANFVQLGSNLQLAGPRIGRKPMINDEQINTKNLGIIIIKHLELRSLPSTRTACSVGANGENIQNYFF